MNKTLVTILIGLGLGFSAGFAKTAKAAEESFAYKDLVRIIESRNAQHKPLKSVDELLRLLPKSVMSHFTFIYDSRGSLQDASPMFPRAIGYNEKMAMTFNGNSDQRGYNALEIMQFDEATRTFQFREVDFSAVNGAAGPKYSTESPHKCLACHGSDPKPIWNQYPNWPGIYGSEDDEPMLHEAGTFPLFIKSLAAHPESRYRNFVFRKGSNVSPYQRTNVPDDFRFRPNLLLTELLTRQNAYRLARVIEESPLWPLYKDAILFSFMSSELNVNCTRAEDVNKISMRLDNHLSDLMIRFNKPRLSGYQQQTKFLNLFGLSPSQFSISRDKPDYFFSEGEFGETEFLLAVLLKDAMAADPELSPHVVFQSRHYREEYKAQPYYAYIDRFLSPVDTLSEDGCRLLARRTEKLLNSNIDIKSLPEPVKGENFVARLAEAEQRRANSAIPVACVYCHVVAGRAPPIPYDNERQLREAIRAEDGRLYKQIIARTSVGASEKILMPPSANHDFAPLSAAEHERLKTYLDTLMH